MAPSTCFSAINLHPLPVSLRVNTTHWHPAAFPVGPLYKVIKKHKAHTNFQARINLYKSLCQTWTHSFLNFLPNFYSFFHSFPLLSPPVEKVCFHLLCLPCLTWCSFFSRLLVHLPLIVSRVYCCLRVIISYISDRIEKAENPLLTTILICLAWTFVRQPSKHLTSVSTDPINSPDLTELIKTRALQDWLHDLLRDRL